MEVHPVTAADEGEDVSQGGVLPRAYDQIPPKYKRLAKKSSREPYAGQGHPCPVPRVLRLELGRGEEV